MLLLQNLADTLLPTWRKCRAQYPQIDGRFIVSDLLFLKLSYKITNIICSGPDLARKLSQLVKMEKNVMRSMELVGRERREVARQLSIWGEECDEDVSDITDKLGVLIFEIGELEDQYIDRYDQYRVTIKSIRNIEASVQPSRDRKI